MTVAHTMNPCVWGVALAKPQISYVRFIRAGSSWLVCDHRWDVPFASMANNMLSRFTADQSKAMLLRRLHQRFRSAMRGVASSSMKPKQHRHRLCTGTGSDHGHNLHTRNTTVHSTQRHKGVLVAFDADTTPTNAATANTFIFGLRKALTTGIGTSKCDLNLANRKSTLLQQKNTNYKR